MGDRSYDIDRDRSGIVSEACGIGHRSESLCGQTTASIRRLQTGSREGKTADIHFGTGIRSVASNPAQSLIGTNEPCSRRTHTSSTPEGKPGSSNDSSRIANFKQPSAGEQNRLYSTCTRRPNNKQRIACRKICFNHCERQSNGRNTRSINVDPAPWPKPGPLVVGKASHHRCGQLVRVQLDSHLHLWMAGISDYRRAPRGITGQS